MEALRRARQQLLSFLLRHGRVYTGRTPWSKAHSSWLCGQTFEHPAHQIVLAEYRHAIEEAEVRLKRLTAQVTETAALRAVRRRRRRLSRRTRGVAFMIAVTFVAEIGYVRRFDNPRQLMAYLGLVPSERWFHACRFVLVSRLNPKNGCQFTL